MPRPFATPSLIAAAALALAVAATAPGTAAAQDNSYYTMRNGYGQGFTAPTGRVWSATPRTGGAGAAVQGQPRAMSQTMARPSTGFAQSTHMGQNPGQYQQGQFQQAQPRTAGHPGQTAYPAPSAGAHNPGFQPLPAGMGTLPGSSTGMGMAPQMKPSPYGMQMQQPNRANLRVDNRVTQPGG